VGVDARVLGKVLLNGQDVNFEQIKAELAWHYKQYGKAQQLADRRLYAEAQKAASLKGTGLWSDSAPVAPWDFRRKKNNKNGNFKSVNRDKHMIVALPHLPYQIFFGGGWGIEGFCSFVVG